MSRTTPFHRLPVAALLGLLLAACTQPSRPELEPPRERKVIQVTSGYGGCLLLDDQSLHCWQPAVLGRVNDNAPREVSPARRFIQVSAEYGHTCAVATDGRAFCWGENYQGELGDGSRRPRSAPVAVAGDLRFTKISAADSHTCGVTAERRAYCWGSNSGGELGVADTLLRSSPLPVPVQGDLDFRTVSAGPSYGGSYGGGKPYTCGITTSDELYCWGTAGRQRIQRNPPGGAADGLFRAPAVQMPGTRFREVSTSWFYTHGIALDGTVFEWGGSSPGAQYHPRPLATDLRFRSFSGRYNDQCGVALDGKGYCRGVDNFGELGRGPELASGHQFGEVVGGIRFAMIDVRGSAACGLAETGSAYCWGIVGEGLTGVNTSNVPVLVRIPPARR